MHGLPNTLFVKSMLVSSPLEGLARRIQQAINKRRCNIELTEIFLEDDRTIAILSRLLRADSNCVDVGCHIGSFLSSILRFAPDGQHIAVEASANKARWLRQKFPSVKIHNTAVSDECGTAMFFEDTSQSGFNRLHKPAFSSSVGRPIETVTLDKILSETTRIDFIKIDVEGGELNALLGARAIISKHRPSIYFECGSNQDLTDLGISRQDLFELVTLGFGYVIYTLPDFLFEKGPLSFDEFRKCGIYPFRAFNFLALPPFAV